MSVVLGQFAPDDDTRGPSAPALTLVDISRNLLRGRKGDVISFYHLNSQAFLGAATLAGSPTVSHSPAAVARMRAGLADGGTAISPLLPRPPVLPLRCAPSGHRDEDAEHDSAATGQASYTTMQAPPYSAHFVASKQSAFTTGFPVSVPLTRPPPTNVTAFWAIGVLESTDNSGAVVVNSTFSDSCEDFEMIRPE